MWLSLVMAASAAEIKPAAVDAVAMDPADAAWSQAVEVSIPVLSQTVAYPKNPAATITAVRVKAQVDGDWLALRIAWDDPTFDERVDVDAYTDAVAVQLPLGEVAKTNPMMGAPTGPVYIAHWKAVWQRDVEDGHADVQDYHPNYWADTYPFVTAKHPFPLEGSFEGTDARRYFVGTSAGNPISAIQRARPVEELTAEGYGTLATQAFQEADAEGARTDKGWVVVIAVPRVSNDPGNPSLGAGKTGVAFAVWDGSAGNVGGRKHWTAFNDVVLP